MAELTWDELKKVLKGWTYNVAEKFGVTEIRCHQNNITNVILSLVNAEDDEEKGRIMDFFITRLNMETFAMLNHLTEPRFFVKTIIIGEYDAWKICLSKEELMNIFKAYALINMQNYTKRVIEIIYGTPENLTAQEFRRLVDKSIDKYDDWRTAEHLLHKYDDKGNLR